MPRVGIGFLPITALFGLLALTGCSQHIVAASNGLDEHSAWVCEAFLPITPAQEGSAVLRQQIIEHNAVWDALCEG